MAPPADSLRHVKARLREALPDHTTRQACRGGGHAWRDRPLTPAVGELRHLSGLAFTDSGYCRARRRLPRAARRAWQRAVAGRARAGPRVRKRRPQQFPVRKRPRAELRQALLAQKDAA